MIAILTATNTAHTTAPKSVIGRTKLVMVFLGFMLALPSKKRNLTMCGERKALPTHTYSM